MRAICGIASDGTIYGTGYSQVKAALESGSQLPASFRVLKFLATTFASISGMPDGIFSPSLAVGAGLGSNIASLFHGAPLAAIMLLGMVSYLLSEFAMEPVQIRIQLGLKFSNRQPIRAACTLRGRRSGTHHRLRHCHRNDR